MQDTIEKQTVKKKTRLGITALKLSLTPVLFVFTAYLLTSTGMYFRIHFALTKEILSEEQWQEATSFVIVLSVLVMFLTNVSGIVIGIKSLVMREGKKYLPIIAIVIGVLEFSTTFSLFIFWFFQAQL